MADGGREAILGRVRQALKRPMPEPHWFHEPVDDGPLFSLPENTESALRERFKAEFAAIQGEWLEADSLDQGRQVFRDWLAAQGIGELLAVDGPAMRNFLGADLPAALHWLTPESAKYAAWESTPLGVTLAESLVVESGTIVVSATQSARAASVLPPIHLVVATADQLTPDLEGSFARMRAKHLDGLPSTLSWISGPSRTADIEKILVLGAHGPKRLVLLLLPANAL
ncbi:MAG: LutC/YkgG family protein [Planctomycetia bacterium]